jgi:hypothetical protein
MAKVFFNTEDTEIAKDTEIETLALAEQLILFYRV